MAQHLLTALPVLLTGLMLGGMVFFAVVFAPPVFKKLPEQRLVGADAAHQ